MRQAVHQDQYHLNERKRHLRFNARRKEDKTVRCLTMPLPFAVIKKMLRQIQLEQSDPIIAELLEQLQSIDKRIETSAGSDDDDREWYRTAGLIAAEIFKAQFKTERKMVPR